MVRVLRLLANEKNLLNSQETRSNAFLNWSASVGELSLGVMKENLSWLVKRFPSLTIHRSFYPNNNYMGRLKHISRFSFSFLGVRERVDLSLLVSTLFVVIECHIVQYTQQKKRVAPFVPANELIRVPYFSVDLSRSFNNSGRSNAFYMNKDIGHGFSLFAELTTVLVHLFFPLRPFSVSPQVTYQIHFQALPPILVPTQALLHTPQPHPLKHQSAWVKSFPETPTAMSPVSAVQPVPLQSTITAVSTTAVTSVLFATFQSPIGALPVLAARIIALDTMRTPSCPSPHLVLVFRHERRVSETDHLERAITVCLSSCIPLVPFLSSLDEEWPRLQATLWFCIKYDIKKIVRSSSLPHPYLPPHHKQDK